MYIISHYYSQDNDPNSHTTCFGRFNSLHEFKVYSERQIFEKLYHGNFIHSQSFCQKKVSRELFSYVILTETLTWGLNHGLTSSKPTYYRLDYLFICIVTFLSI